MAFIFKVTDYLDDQDRQVQERTLVSGEPPDGWTRFCTFGMKTAELPFGSLQVRYMVPIPGAETSGQAFAQLEQALEDFQPEAERLMEKKVREIIQEQQNSLLVPRAGLPAAPGQPDGKIIKL